MRFGFCTEFAAVDKNIIDYDLVRRIKEAGYDYVEFPLMLIEKISDEEFEKVVATVKELNLSCEVCCGMFPKTVKLTGPQVDKEQIAAYLEKAFSRAAVLGTHKIVLGSAPARELPEGTDWETGYSQMAEMLVTQVAPLCEKYDVEIVIEPLRSNACNFIHTLTDGMELVNRANSPYVKLLGDSLHMLTNEEDPNHIIEYKDDLRHVHIAEEARGLPEDGYSEYVAQVLKNLKSIGYDNTVSFEAKGGKEPDSMKKALELLKAQF